MTAFTPKLLRRTVESGVSAMFKRIHSKGGRGTRHHPGIARGG